MFVGEILFSYHSLSRAVIGQVRYNARGSLFGDLTSYGNPLISYLHAIAYFEDVSRLSDLELMRHILPLNLFQLRARVLLELGKLGSAFFRRDNFLLGCFLGFFFGCFFLVVTSSSS